LDQNQLIILLQNKIERNIKKIIKNIFKKVKVKDCKEWEEGWKWWWKRRRLRLNATK
jgi:hypothetical protein